MGALSLPSNACVLPNNDCRVRPICENAHNIVYFANSLIAIHSLFWLVLFVARVEASVFESCLFVCVGGLL